MRWRGKFPTCLGPSQMTRESHFRDLGFDVSSSLSDGSATERLQGFEARVQALAEHLRKAGIARLGLYASNGLAWAEVDLACVLAEICLVPIPTFFSDQQRNHVIESCVLDAIVTDSVAPFAGHGSTRLEALSTTTRLIDLRTSLPASHEAPLLPIGSGKITFTSGSTGTPKGVCLSHSQLLRQARVLADRVALQAPKHLCILPLTTLLENVAGLYAPLLAGGTVVIPSQESMGFKGSALLEPKKLLQTLSEQKPNSLILIPQLLQLLVGAVAQGWRVPDSLRFVAVGGSRVSEELLASAQSAGIPVFEGYGLSECASVVSLNSIEQNSPGSCGSALPGLQISVHESELVVEGNCMLGYMNEPSSWYPERVVTGDLGRIDEAGFIHIEGRKKNLLISSYGRNISPEWVESELLANPLLSEAVVLGDARPYCVALIWSRTLRNSEDEALAAWIRQVNGILPDYAQIRAWLLLPSSLQSTPQFMTENGRPRRSVITKNFQREIEELYSQTTN